MNKGIIALMAVAGIGLGGGVVSLEMMSDGIPPVIEFQKDEVIYSEGDSYDVFLEGVTAQDDRDGDVTDSLVVESVYLTESGQHVMVIYVARDKENNVAKVSKWLSCKPNPDAAAAGKEDTEEEEESADDKMDELKAALIASQTEVPEPTDEPVSEPIQEPTPEPEKEQEPAEKDEISAENPRITLKTDQVTISAGEEIQRLAYVESVTDDKDEAVYLWQNILIDGDEFDKDTPGVYEQIYYVVDSDGNKSNKETLTITVE